MNTGDQCPICGTGSVNKKVVTETFEYKGRFLEYPDYIVFECDSCEEEFVDKKTMKESGRAIKDFYRKVDGLLVASEIYRIRKFRLELNQDDASKIIGGGPKSFNKYENSDVIQSEAVDNLLRVLDANPHMIDIIINKHKPPVTAKVTTMVLKTNPVHVEANNVTASNGGF
jgi:HTH-type transcriptional regulator/antitoxin MqsA